MITPLVIDQLYVAPAVVVTLAPTLAALPQTVDGAVTVATGGVQLEVNELALVATPPVVVTEIGPVVAPAGTTAVICVALLIVNEAAGVPLNDTPLVPMKLVPVMVTLVPAPPLDGVKPVMVGALVVKHFPAEATL